MPARRGTGPRSCADLHACEMAARGAAVASIRKMANHAEHDPLGRASRKRERIMFDEREPRLCSEFDTVVRATGRARFAALERTHCVPTKSHSLERLLIVLSSTAYVLFPATT